MLNRILLALLFASATGAAIAQSQTFYDSAGRSVGRSVTDSQGSKTFYDASGKVTGRSSTTTDSTTTIYDAAGRNVGKTTYAPARK
jgi:YD repeat-containing protein